MKIKRLSFIHSLSCTKVVDYELPKSPKTKFRVDDSCFIPVSEALKSINHNSVTASEATTYYDFADGRDTGKKIPITRRADMRDIAEISNAIIDEAKELAERKEKLLNKALTEKAINDSVAKANASLNVNPPTSTNEK